MHTFFIDGKIDMTKIAIKKGYIHSELTGSLDMLEQGLTCYLVGKDNKYKFFWSMPNMYGEEGVFKTCVLKVAKNLPSIQKPQLNLNDWNGEQSTIFSAVQALEGSNVYGFLYRQKYDVDKDGKENVWKSYVGTLEATKIEDVPKDWSNLINNTFLNLH